jgi:hypothetical protein
MHSRLATLGGLACTGEPSETSQIGFIVITTEQ